jgi:hypothetical protein
LTGKARFPHVKNPTIFFPVYSWVVSELCKLPENRVSPTFDMNKNCFPDDGSCDENFEMTLTGMESHGTRYDQNIRNKFENDLLIAKCG